MKLILNDINEVGVESEGAYVHFDTMIVDIMATLLESDVDRVTKQEQLVSLQDTLLKCARHVSISIKSLNPKPPQLQLIKD